VVPTDGRCRAGVRLIAGIAIGGALLMACGDDDRPSVTLPTDVTLPSRPTSTQAPDTTEAPTTTAEPTTTRPPLTTRPPATTEPPTTEPPTTEPPTTQAPPTTEPPTTEPPTTEAPATTEEAAPPPTEEAGAEAEDTEDEGSSGVWLLIAAIAGVLALLIALFARRRQEQEEAKARAELAAAREQARALADLARSTATAADPNARASQWARFDRDRDDLTRTLSGLSDRPSIGAAVADLERTVTDLAEAVAHDRDLRLSADATEDQTAFSRAGVLERADAVTEATRDRPAQPPA
jgi:hypothetical protein